MSEAYLNVVGGGLKLKGSGIKKNKSKKSSESSALTTAASSLSRAEVAADTAARAAASSSSDPPDLSVPRYTDTERRRMEVLERRKHEAAAAGKIKSHREQVKDFNEYLGALPEHYDLPKVSKGN
jgi:protein FAM32A